MAASIFWRLRTMLASCISFSTVRGVNRATLLGVEVRERAPIAVALAQDRPPAQPGLRCFEDEELEVHAIVAHGHAPFLVVIPHVRGVHAFAPRAPHDALSSPPRRQPPLLGSALKGTRKRHGIPSRESWPCGHKDGLPGPVSPANRGQGPANGWSSNRVDAPPTPNGECAKQHGARELRGHGESDGRVRSIRAHDQCDLRDRHQPERRELRLDAGRSGQYNVSRRTPLPTRKWRARRRGRSTKPRALSVPPMRTPQCPRRS